MLLYIGKIFFSKFLKDFMHSMLVLKSEVIAEIREKCMVSKLLPSEKSPR